jgi:dienelactone hydrolase
VRGRRKQQVKAAGVRSARATTKDSSARLRVASCLVLLGAMGLVGMPQSRDSDFEQLSKYFEYDHRLPLDIREIGLKTRDGVQVHEITYASPRGDRVPAYVVVPGRTGRFAAILFGHWMRKGSPFRNRNEFLEEAVLLARSGAVCLLTDAPGVRPGFHEESDLLRSAEQASRASQQQVIDFRRGIDLLLAHFHAAPNRIAYVGHSFNAHVGAILAGVEKRIQSFVLMAGAYADEENTFSSTSPEVMRIRQQIGDEKIRAYFRQYAWDDPVYYLAHSAPAAVFLQFASKDQSDEQARRYYDAFGSPKKMKIYEAVHALNVDARRDRTEWLIQRLALDPVDPDMLKHIPELK